MRDILDRLEEAGEDEWVPLLSEAAAEIKRMRNSLPMQTIAHQQAEIERLRAALRGATDMVEQLGVPLSYSGQAELDGYRRALEGK